MNVFVLCTGRCGSTTLIAACRHIENYTAAHESRSHLIGDDRLDYPTPHIEADNRLSWILGRLDRKYGDNACYIHLTRDPQQTARSFLNRWDRGIIGGYARSIIMGGDDLDRLQVCLDYCETVTRNIESFLRDKTHTMVLQLETLQEDFPQFWELIGAQGDLAAAIRELSVRHNASPVGLRHRLSRRSGTLGTHN